MILGIGTDLCDVRRIERSIERFGDRFLQRIFTESERARAATLDAPATSYAKRFAAKEACAKALGSGFADGVGWRDVGVENLDDGRPVLVLAGGAEARLARITPPGFAARLDLSLSDEPPLACAFVVISATRIDGPA